MKPVTIYSKDYCPYCTRIMNFFSAKGVPFKLIDITDDVDAMRRLVAQTNWRTVPQVFIGEKFVGGCDDVLELESKGELAPLLE